VKLTVATLMVLAIVVAGCGADDGERRATASTTIAPDSGPTIETMPHGPISLGTTYGTYDAVKPNVAITPQSEGWHLGAYSCSGQLTSIRLATEAGRMYIVLTAGVDAGEAVTQLMAGPLENASVTDTTIAGWAGQVVAGQLVADIDTARLGNFINGDATNRLFPYFRVRGANFPLLTEPAANEDPETARILFRPLVPGDSAEVHVVDTPAGALSVAVTTTAGTLEEFRSAALATADTLTIDGTAGIATC
jgi:hypothetical protein